MKTKTLFLWIIVIGHNNNAVDAIFEKVLCAIISSHIHKTMGKFTLANANNTTKISLNDFFSTFCEKNPSFNTKSIQTTCFEKIKKLQLKIFFPTNLRILITSATLMCRRLCGAVAAALMSTTNIMKWNNIARYTQQRPTPKQHSKQVECVYF